MPAHGRALSVATGRYRAAQLGGQLPGGGFDGVALYRAVLRWTRLTGVMASRVEARSWLPGRSRLRDAVLMRGPIHVAPHVEGPERQCLSLRVVSHPTEFDAFIALNCP